MSELVAVNVGKCQCPLLPHEKGTRWAKDLHPHPEGDVVSLRPKLGLAAGIELQQKFRALLQMDPRPSHPEITGLLTEAYLLVGVAEWTLTDDMGPIPVSRENIATYLLSDFELAQPVADVADDMYYGPVLSPLVASLSSSLRGMPTKRLTSATNGSSQKPRKRSKRSSTSTTQTDATAPTTG